MASVLAGIKSRFIRSISDHPEIREVFRGLRIKPVTLKYSVSKEKQTTGRE
jgi:DNA adenine methylase